MAAARRYAAYRPILIVAAVVLAAVLIYGLAVRSPESRPAATLAEATIALPGGKAFTDPRPIQPFELVDHHGRPFDVSRLQGKWTYMFFGYTHCPDVCPTTLMTFQQAHRRLQEAGEPLDDIQFVLVSVDPERDTVETLGPYVSYFHPDFLGVTGSERALQQFTDQLGVFSRRVDQRGDDYLVEHSGTVVLTDPQARLYALFPAPHDPRAIAASYLEVSGRAGARATSPGSVGTFLAQQ